MTHFVVHIEGPGVVIAMGVNVKGRVEEVALPVGGLCQLVQGESAPVSEPEPFVSGRLLTSGATVPLLDLDRVVEHCIQPAAQAAREVRR